MIVASILLAFAVDAAWERLGEGEEREALLNALEQDLIAVEAELDRVEDSRRAAHEAAAEVLTHVQGGTLEEVGDAELGALVFDLTYTATFDAPFGAVEALLNGGNLELLRDPILARLLTALPSAVADLEREQVRGMRYADEYYAAIAELGYSLANLPDPTRELPWEIHEGELARFLSDPVVASHTTNLWYSHTETIHELTGVRELVDSIRARLAERQAGGN